MALWSGGFSVLFLAFLCCAVRSLQAVEGGEDAAGLVAPAHLEPYADRLLQQLPIDSLSKKSADQVSAHAGDDDAAAAMRWTGNDVNALHESLRGELGKRRWGENTMHAWEKRVHSSPEGADIAEPLTGDRQLQEADEKRAWQNNMRVWGKRDPEANKKWGKNTMRVWGKRDGADFENQNEADKRKWTKTMKVWGKRSGDVHSDAEKRKWTKTMKVWGKRDGESDDSKRAWQGNTMRVWGKRDGDQLPASVMQQEAALQRQIPEDVRDKKAWDKNMRVWGKRSISKRSIDLEDLDDLEKRAWNTESMRVWGKRRNRVDEGPKRSWKNNVMRVWGKRDWQSPLASVDGLDDAVADAEQMAAEKRGWDTNTLRTWGKRTTGLSDDRLAALIARYL